MAQNVQHCPACATEFEWWVRSCSDCDGQLQPGPLPESQDVAVDEPVAERQLVADIPRDYLLAELPGEQADRVARALAMQEITSVLECEGIVQIHAPDRQPSGALAMTLPVAIYVAPADVSTASEVMQSLTVDGTVVDPLASGVASEALEAEAVKDGEVDTSFSAIPGAEATGPTQESTTGRLLLLLALAIVVMLLFFRS